MKQESYSPDTESFEVKKYGVNVTIRNFWQRHAQKASGEVFNATKTGISASSISTGGSEMAEKLGTTIQASQHGAKGYKSDSARTQETFDALMRGYKKVNPDVPIREKVRFRKELISPKGTEEWLKEYN